MTADTKYSPASPMDPLQNGLAEGTNGKANGHSITEPENQRPTESKMQRCAFYSCFAGFFFILLGLALAIAMGPVIENKIRKNLRLTPDAKSFPRYIEPPVTPVLYFRVFNLTNEEAFLAGREKPNMVELGPYVYTEKITKTNVAHSNNDEVLEFTTNTKYEYAPQFKPDVGFDDNDVIVVPNVPLFGGMQKLRQMGQLGLGATIFKSYLESYEFARDLTPFIKVTVREFLWGYPSLLMTLGRNRENGCDVMGGGGGASDDDDEWGDFGDDDDFGFDVEVKKKKKEKVKEKIKEGKDCSIREDNLAEFGLLEFKDGKDVHLRQIKTGATNLTEKGEIVSWKGMTEIDYWPEGSHCNSLVGTRDPSGFPVDLKKEDRLDLFLGALGRDLTFKYQKEVEIDDPAGGDPFKTYRFVPLEDSFDNPEVNADNWCYCVKKPCLPSGLHDISTAEKDSPILVSWPHFLYGDPKLRRAVQGMRPDAEKHSFTFDVLPQYGIALSAMARMQLVVEVRRDSGFGYFDGIQDDVVYLPFCWLDEGLTGPDELMGTRVRKLLTMPTKVRGLSCLLGILVGLGCLVPEIYFWVKSCFRPKTDSTEEERAEEQKLTESA